MGKSLDQISQDLLTLIQQQAVSSYVYGVAASSPMSDGTVNINNPQTGGSVNAIAHNNVHYNDYCFAFLVNGVWHTWSATPNEIISEKTLITRKVRSQPAISQLTATLLWELNHGISFGFPSFRFATVALDSDFSGYFEYMPLLQDQTAGNSSYKENSSNSLVYGSDGKSFTCSSSFSLDGAGIFDGFGPEYSSSMNSSYQRSWTTTENSFQISDTGTISFTTVQETEDPSLDAGYTLYCAPGSISFYTSPGDTISVSFSFDPSAYFPISSEQIHFDLQAGTQLQTLIAPTNVLSASATVDSPGYSGVSNISCLFSCLPPGLIFGEGYSTITGTLSINLTITVTFNNQNQFQTQYFIQQGSKLNQALNFDSFNFFQYVYESGLLTSIKSCASYSLTGFVVSNDDCFLGVQRTNPTDYSVTNQVFACTGNSLTTYTQPQTIPPTGTIWDSWISSYFQNTNALNYCANEYKESDYNFTANNKVYWIDRNQNITIGGVTQTLLKWLQGNTTSPINAIANIQSYTSTSNSCTLTGTSTRKVQITPANLANATLLGICISP